MADIVENSQIEEYIKNLKGKKTYEQNKAIKLGFPNFEEYIANKISKEFSDLMTVHKAPRQRIKTKKKIEPNPAKTCGCC